MLSTEKMSVTSTRRRTLNLPKLPHSTRVKHILQKYVVGEDVKEYEQLVCSIRDNVFEDDEIHSLLAEATQCISILNQDLRLFVEAILVLKWAHKSDSIVQEYRSFLVNLLCAHNYHMKHAIDQLIAYFNPDESEKEWLNGVPSDEDCRTMANVHSVINIILKVIPMSRELLQQCFISQYPYLKRSTHKHEVYLHSLLWVLDYQPEFRLEFFYLIFNRLILLDVNAPKEEILRAQEGQLDEEMFSMDDVKSVKSFVDSDNMRHPLAHTLDVCLDKILNFIIAECHDLTTGQLNWDKTKSLYQTMVYVFDKVILPTYNIHHVQFAIFFVCSFKVTLCEAFLGHLWKKVCNPNVPSVHRQTAVTYIASLLARAAFIPLTMLKSTIHQMTAWIHSYIHTQDGLECINSDVRVHAVFYSVCQALFYVVAFRHKDLVNTRKNITFLESLNLAKMVTCRLNPLRVCQAAVVQNFAAVTRMYQLAYCYTVIEHNTRSAMPTVYLDEKGCVSTSSSLLESFFPFDPYLLKRSGQKIAPLYLEYKAADDEDDETVEFMEEDDDFLNDHHSPGIASPTRHSDKRFSYGTSPGFRYKS
ncbi:Tif-IA [Carabus blaptoides fortunei]